MRGISPSSVIHSTVSGVMLLKGTLMLILLQLHASSTLTDNDNEQNLSIRKMKSIHRLEGAVQHKTTSHEPMRLPPSQDEDLLDLMVRIAQSPSEWERIQQVLSQLGGRKITETPDGKEEVLNEPNVVTRGSRNVARSKDPAQSYSDTPSVTSLLNFNTNYVDSPAYQSSQIQTTQDPDSGWPDFEEAILKKVRKRERKSDTVLHNSLYENDWFDTSWRDLVNEVKDQEPSLQDLNIKAPAVNFVKLNISEGLDGKTSRPLPSRENVLSTHAEDYLQDVSNRSSRPVFMYHRVTTSPQERKSNSAIIAVSVARREFLDTSSSATSNKQSTQRIQDTLEDSFKRNFERHRSKERKEHSPLTPEHLRHQTRLHH